MGPVYSHAHFAFGNLASMKNHHQVSKPREAGLQSLEKMKFLMDKGLPQMLMPPSHLPRLKFLKRLGFDTSSKNVLQKVWDFSPDILASCYSSSSVWLANCATVSCSADTKDHKVHFTPANLHFSLHRSLETEHSHFLLKKIFHKTKYFTHHDPLPCSPVFADEGAANHNRLCTNYDQAGLNIFTYGYQAFKNRSHTKFPPRQSKEAMDLIVRQHSLDLKNTLFVQQNPQAIDAGVFHNDVIFTSDKNLIFYHEKAFLNTEQAIQKIQDRFIDQELLQIKVTSQEIPLKNVVSSYLFNSQLLPTNTKHQWQLLAPQECKTDPIVYAYLQALQKRNNFIKDIHFIPVHHSMKNGGGPACLRLRIVLTEQESQGLHQGVCLNEELYQTIKHWITKHYREQLLTKDLLDPLLITESQRALDELSHILKLGNIYDFQN